MSRKGWGWWQQLQSGEYRKTKLKYGDIGWVTDEPSILEPSHKTSSSRNTQSTIPKHLPKHRFIAEYREEFRALANANNQLKASLPNAIKEPQITIAKIQKMLNEVYEANKLHELLSSALNNLKEVYKKYKSDFSKRDIAFLKKTSNINNSLTLLIKTKDELVQQINQFRRQYPKS
jgi:hypothetical protein